MNRCTIWKALPAVGNTSGVPPLTPDPRNPAPPYVPPAWPASRTRQNTLRTSSEQRRMVCCNRSVKTTTERDAERSSSSPSTYRRY